MATQTNIAEELLYLSIRELAYVQDIENCDSGLCASEAGKILIKRGMELLKIASLREENLSSQREFEEGERRGKL